MNIRTILLTGAGLLLLALGAIGVFLPLLPTTPFVLAGVGCLSGTPKLRAKVLQIAIFREYYESYQNRNGLSSGTVVKSLVYLWGMLIISIFLSGKLWVICLLPVIGICVTCHILHMAKPREKKKK